jgi:predicted transposase YdaD
MNTFQRAIVRMEALDAACTELITMAQKDIAELEIRRANARKLIEMWENLKQPDSLAEVEIATHLEWSPEELKMTRKTMKITHDMYLRIEEQAREIADREPQTVSCMLVWIKV